MEIEDNANIVGKRNFNINRKNIFLILIMDSFFFKKKQNF